MRFQAILQNSSRVLFFFFSLFCVSNSLIAQTSKFTVSGTIKDSTSGETLLSTAVRVKELSNVGVYSNEYGFYSLTIPEGNYTLVINSFGFVKKEIPIKLTKNLTVNIDLSKPKLDKIQELQEVKVTGTKENKNVSGAETGMVKMDVKALEKIPVFAGEKDIIKTFTLTPGFKTAGEGNSGFFVRGGAADQNLILLDEAPVYNASHLLGFFSTFNSDALKEVTLYKGGMPSQYGGRTSSVLDIKMLDGNDKKYHVGGGIGIISSRLSVEGPIVKNKGSFMISGRRTYADVFLKLTDEFKDNRLYFYDLNLKANYKINDKNRIFLSGYFGQDNLGLGELFGINWGNATGTIRWNSVINPKLFSNTSLIFSNYNYKIAINTGTLAVDIRSKIQDYNIKQDFTYIINPTNKLKFGVNAIHHTITPGQIESDDPNFVFEKLQDRFAWENAGYVSHEWNPNERLSFIYGLRATNFSLMGPGDFYSFDAEGVVLDTTSYNSGKIVQNYFNLEPRFTSSFMIDSTSSLKLGYARNVQNLHLISNSTSSTPTDLWIPSSANVKPEISDQLSLGYFRNFFNNRYEFSVEAYYKDMQNQIDYKDGASTIANDLVEGELLYGKGRAYGVELFFKKKYGRFNGWISYTLSRTEKQIDGINNSQWYAARQDRTHDLSLVGIYDINDKLSVSATWIFYTGSAVTFPSGKYYIDGNIQWLYTERNGYRMPNYHRLDLSVTYYNKKTDKFESSWNFGIYNAYARENAWTISFRESETDPTKTEAVQIALFRLVPSITYNFKF
ncbi:MAG: TonB-dependent receptor [Flavobacteriales bacterium]|nr:TonB-dependent receptor [Flavobacteriales bacterium]